MKHNYLEEIDWPDAAEKEAQIHQITARATLQPRHFGSILRSLCSAAGLRGIFFGVWDCMLLALLLDGSIWAVVYEASKNSPQLPGLLVFLASPVFYALFHLLTVWKEKMTGMYQTLMVCRLSLHQMTVLRLLLSTGASALLLCGVHVPAGLYAEEIWPVLRLAGISFTALFFYAWMQLIFEWKCKHQIALGAAPALWCGMGAALLAFGDRTAYLWEEIPAALLVFSAVVCGGGYVRGLKKFYFEAGIAEETGYLL